MSTPKQNIVIIDVDNTIHESDITLNLASMELFNSPFRWCQQPEWYTGGDDALTMEQACKVFDRVLDREMIFLTKPYIGAKEGLDLIQSLGYEVRYYTDRRPHAHADTYDWLVEHGLPNPDSLKCCSDKRAALAEVKDSIVTVVDDRVRTLLYAQYTLGVEKVFSLRHPYNRNLSDAPNIYLAGTWKELATKFQEQIGEFKNDGDG